MLRGNSASYCGGGAYSGTLNNSTLTSNSASCGGGVSSNTLNNCTLTGNSAPYGGGGAYYGTLNNCIVYNNSAGGNYSGGTLRYCCTTPIPGSGTGNFTNAPLFVDQTDGDLHLQTNSPCINAGLNKYVSDATDLDGNPRISGGTVDMGAYEFQSPPSLISYAWLQSYGLPTDGTADNVDADLDGMNNWQEWQAGTDPTNAASVLTLQSSVSVPGRVTLTWPSVTSRTYSVERATNLVDQPAFAFLRTNISGLSGTTSFTDTNPPASSPAFYRVGVQP